MAQIRTFRIAKLSDKQIFQLINAIAEEFRDFSGDAYFSAQLKCALPNSANEDYFRTKMFAVEKFKGSSSEHNLCLHLARGTSDANWATRIPSSYQDEIQIFVQNSQNTKYPPKIVDFLKLAEIVQNHTTEIDSTDISSDPNFPITILTAEIQKLAELQTGLIEGADKKRRELDSLKSELDAKYEAKEAHLSESFKQKENELTKEKSALEKQRKELDDREHKHVRRELRTSINAEIDDELSKENNPLSSASSDLLGMYVAALAACALGYFTYLTQISLSEAAVEVVRDENGVISQKPSSAPTVWLLYLKLFVSAGATFGLILYIISWFRNLSHDVRQYRRQLLRDRFDINRASWTIETILEMSEKEQLDVPNIWLERVTENMFV